MKKTTGFAVAGICLALAAHGSANVFDDAVFWFRGGKDKNTDGYIDYGEFFDDLRASTPNDGNHNMTMSSTLYTGQYNSMFKGNAVFGKEQVVFPALGKSAAKDDVQVLHISDTAVLYGNKYYYFPFAVNPRHVLARNEVSNEYTIVGRIRLDDDNTHRSYEKCFLKIGYNTNDLARQGMWLGFKEQTTSTGCRQITGRRIDSTGTDSGFDLDLHVPTNTWVDLAVVVCNGSLRVGIAVPQSLSAHGNNSTIAFAETDIRTDNYELLEDPDGLYYMMFCRDGQKSFATGNSIDTTAFIGSVQQIAIWKRALEDEEVMAAFGMPRPMIFRTGLDNGNSNEFGGKRSGSSQEIDGLGSWQNIASTMKAGDTWTVNFTALRDEAGLPQIFSIKSLRSSAAQIEVTLTNATHNVLLGENLVASNGRTFWPVPANLITNGANTLIIRRTDSRERDFIMDAMELGGSLGVGAVSNSADDGRVLPEIIATGVPSAADPNPAHWPMGFRPYFNDNTNLTFKVWVDPEIVGACTSRFWTCVKCVQYGSTRPKGTEYFTIFVNENAKTNFYANGSWKDIALDFSPGVLHGGWNDFEIRSAEAYKTLYWQFDYFRFETVLPKAFGYPPQSGMMMLVR